MIAPNGKKTRDPYLKEEEEERYPGKRGKKWQYLVLGSATKNMKASELWEAERPGSKKPRMENEA